MREPWDRGAAGCTTTCDDSARLGLEPEQPNRCEEEWGESASQGFEPGSGVIWSPECLGCWGDRYLWHPNTLRGDGAIPGRTGAAPVHGERGAGGRPRGRKGRGGGGPPAVATATRVARSTIGRGLAELRLGRDDLGSRIRRPGGGRKPAVETQPGLLEALSELVQSAIPGDPEAALLWVSKSQRHLARALTERGFATSLAR